MSSPWKIIRKDVVIADLATTDIDMEALQSEGAGMKWASPYNTVLPGGIHASEWMFVVYAYDNSGVVVAGTLDAQVIEKSPAVWTNPEGDPAFQYVGANPEVGIPTGRGFTVRGASFSEFSVRLSNVTAPGATKLRVEYRPLR